MAAIEAASSCGPQPYAQPPPPIAHAPNPTVVISRSVAPSRRLSSAMRVVFMAVVSSVVIVRREDTSRSTASSRCFMSSYNLDMTEDAIDRIVHQSNRQRPELDVSPTHVLQRVTPL